MRNLSASDIANALRRGASVEQFMGRSPASDSHVRYIELRPANHLVEIWVCDVEDIGSEDLLDLYDFPYLNSDSADFPLATFGESSAAIDYTRSALATDPARWTSFGVAQSEYLDYIRAGRPTRWPAA